MTTTPLLSYHNNPKIKRKYLARMRKHRRLEHLMQGVGFESNGTTKGCAVGCTLDDYDHSRYPIELGLPEWLARLEDKIFEGLPKGDAEQFAEDFLRMIPVGVDVEPVRHKLAVARIDQSLIRLEPNKEPYAVECRNALNLVKAWHLAEIDGKGTESAAWSAESAARSAASAARSAAWSAAWSAESAARSAESAARSAHYQWEAATLLKLLSEAA